MKIKGLDAFNKKLNDLEKKARKLDGTHNVPLKELLNPSFMVNYSNFSNVDEMLQATGFKVENQDDFEAIPEKDLNDFVCQNTKFQTWNDMLKRAGEEYFKKQLGF